MNFPWTKEQEDYFLQISVREQLAVGEFKVLNTKGLHTRPCAEIVRLASQFSCRIFICYRGATVEAHSLLGLMALAVSEGEFVGIYALGKECKRAVTSLEEIASNKFYIKY